MSELMKLAERCEEAKGCDRELDVHIHYAVELNEACSPELAKRHATSEFISAHPVDDGVGGIQVLVRDYTASLDAAMTLVPEGYEWSARWGELPDRTWAGIAGVQGVNTAAATPALALCAAALRAAALRSSSMRGE